MYITILFGVMLGIFQCFNSGAQAQIVELTMDNVSTVQISTHDLLLKVGTEANATLTPTDLFPVVYQNISSASLVFDFDIKDKVIIYPAKVSLVVNGSLFQNSTTVTITAIQAGHVLITAHLESVPIVNDTLSLSNVFVRVVTFKSSILLILGSIVGWLYFLAWSISFYPQIYWNWRRKSVRGLSLDMVLLNVTGFFVYGIYNVGLFWIPEIQEEYFTKYPTDSIPVQLNDVIFTLHAIFASSVTLIQCIIYEKGTQTVSTLGRLILMFIYTFILVMLVVTVSTPAVNWLVFLTICSSVKLFITLVKYVPQVCLNWKRKSTSGWCIGNVLLDFTGGIFSIFQMIIIGYNQNDWISLITDFTKFGLGFFSICFDIVFIVQHYCIYRNHAAYEPIEGSYIPVDPYEDMQTSNHIQQDDEDDIVNSTSSTEE